MKINYLGHSSFLITGKTNTGEEVSLVTDPFDPKAVGLSYSKQKADIVTISHNHPDHFYLKNIEGEANNGYFLIETPGEYELKGLRVFGIKSFHDDKNGLDRGGNIMYVYDFAEATIAHLGDIGHTLDSNQLELLEEVDILMIPVGGKFTVDPKIAMQIIESIEPKIVIPMHYKSEKMIPAYDELSTLQGFLAEAGTEATTEKNLIIKAKSDLPQETKIIPLSF